MNAASRAAAAVPAEMAEVQIMNAAAVAQLIQDQILAVCLS